MSMRCYSPGADLHPIPIHGLGYFFRTPLSEPTEAFHMDRVYSTHIACNTDYSQTYDLRNDFLPGVKEIPVELSRSLKNRPLSHHVSKIHLLPRPESLLLIISWTQKTGGGFGVSQAIFDDFFDGIALPFKVPILRE